MQSLKVPMDAGTKSLEGVNSDYITSDSLTENQHSSSQHEYCHGRVNGQKDILSILTQLHVQLSSYCLKPPE